MTPPGPGSFTATFLRITVGVWMVPSSLGLNRWLLGPKTCARWSRSPPLDRLPPLGQSPLGPNRMPETGFMWPTEALVPLPRAFLCRRAVMSFSLSATFLCITGGSRRGKTSLCKGCAFWAWMMMPSSSGDGLDGVVRRRGR